MVDKDNWWKSHTYRSAGVGFPLLLIIIGAYYLLKSLGYITEEIPFWPILLIAIGIYWLGQRVVYNFYTKR
jgi:uncharacterized membrane protein